VGPISTPTSSCKAQNIDTTAVFGSLDYTLAHVPHPVGRSRYTRADDSFAMPVYPRRRRAASASHLLARWPIPRGACVTLSPPRSWSAGPPSWRSHQPDQRCPGARRELEAGQPDLLLRHVTRAISPVSSRHAGLFPTSSIHAAESSSPMRRASRRALLEQTLQVAARPSYYDYTDKQILGFILHGVRQPARPCDIRSHVRGAAGPMAPYPQPDLQPCCTYVDSKVCDHSRTTTASQSRRHQGLAVPPHPSGR